MKRSEKRLLFFLLILALLGAGVVGSDLYFDRLDQLESERTALENEWIEIDTLFEDRERWEMRANWLREHQPEFSDTEEIDQSIFDRALAEEVAGVTTSRRNLLPTARTEHYVQAGVSLEARGELAPVLRWFHDLTRPSSFRVIRNLELTPDEKEEGRVVARFDLLRWYAPPSES